jgi:predicted CxxxxCH...CXXCH cytochrome family protein
MLSQERAMNRSLFKSLVAVMLLLALPYVAMAVDAPHNPGAGTNQILCNNCHSIHDKLSTGGWENICMTCHRPGGTSIIDGPVVPFTQADFSNVIGTYTSARPGRLYQTSHKWLGSTVVPKAGAQEPLDPDMTTFDNTYGSSNLIGQLSCARCHDVMNYRGNASRGNDYLRDSNANDHMCLDCHRTWDKTSTTYGTHPVNINYAAKAAGNPNLRSTPLNSNPANPTSDLNARMARTNGLLVCSTCHGVHYTDSNSATFDNRTSAIFGRLSTSAGFILRTDLRGSTANAVNICTNCHINKTAHNAANQNIQCADCHGGHVDTGINGDTANVKVVRRYMNYSSYRGRNPQVFFTVTGNQAVYKNAASTGVCQACHQVPASGTAANGKTYPTEHDVATGTKATCGGCHSHTSSSGSFSGGCTNCHGFPPQTNTVGGPNGKVSAGAPDESATKHKKHYDLGYKCLECHYTSDATRHMNGNLNDVFVSGTGIAYTGGANPVYTPGSNTCANVYCHSTGRPNGVLAFKSTFNWSGAAATCNSCHDASPSTNVHQQHLVGAGLGCRNCHSETVADNSTIENSAKHANGSKDVRFYSATLPITGGTIAGGSCSTVYCHSDGQGNFSAPVWATTPTNNCGVCHGASGKTSGSHQQHLDVGVTYGPRLNQFGAPTSSPVQATSCNYCHNYPNGHLNGSFQEPQTCATACHPDNVNQSSPTWGDITRLACESCHAPNASYINKYAPYKANFAGSRHGATKTCTDCHDQNSAHIGVVGGTKRLLLPNDNNLCASCHKDAGMAAQFRNVTGHFLARGGQPVMNCQVCHDPHATTNTAMIRSTIAFNNSTAWVINFTNRTTGFVDNTTNRGLCQVCHTSTNHYRAGVPDNHMAGQKCTTCHPHKGSSGLGAFKPVGGTCDGCHGYPPAPRVTTSAVTFGIQGSWSSARFEDYSGGGGAHLVAAHIKKDAKPSEAWANCGVCHNGGQSHSMTLPLNNTSNVENVTVSVDKKYKFSNNSQFITYTGAKTVDDPSLYKSGSCFNVSCHFKSSPRWSMEK